MVECDKAELIANKSDWQVYCKYHDFVIKLNKRKKKLYMKIELIISKMTVKSYGVHRMILSALPADLANHMQNYFIERVDNLINKMPKIDNGSSYKLIKHRIMRDKHCKFKFDNISVSYVEKLISTCKDKPAGVDGLESKLLKMVSEVIAPAICHIINLTFNECVYPSKWKIAKKYYPCPKMENYLFLDPVVDQ